MSANDSTTSTSVHPSAIGSNTNPPTSSSDKPRSEFGEKAAVGAIDERGDAKEQGPGPEGSSGPTEENGYPEQLHAGKVGYGPHYHETPTFGDKISGLKEEIVGKVTGKPDLVQHGHDKVTGELKKREMEEDMAQDPFSDPEEKKQDQEAQQTEKRQ